MTIEVRTMTTKNSSADALMDQTQTAVEAGRADLGEPATSAKAQDGFQAGSNSAPMKSADALSVSESSRGSRSAASSADALTYQEVEALAEKHGFAISAFDYTDSNSLVDLVNDAIRAASRDSQPAAAPIPEDCDVRNILLDVVPGEDGEGQEVYARNVADVERLLSEMGEKLDAVDAAKQPALSPADERGARAEAALRALADECENDAIAGWEERMRRCIDDANRVLARAASANETGAEWAPIPAGYALVPRVLTQAMDGVMHRAWQLGSTQHLWDVALAAAPQPAQADARVGLADALRRAREELSIVEWENDPPSRVVKLFDEIDALLQGANHGR